MITSELESFRGRFGAADPVEILRAAAERFSGRITFTTGFGAEGCVLIDLIARNALPIEISTLDTGLLWPETYELWRRLEARYGITIRAVKPEQTVDEQAAAHGPTLWERDPDRCCELRKVQPLQKALTGFDAWVTAIRRDQTPQRANAQIVENDARFGLVKVNPLVAWTNKNVWDHLLKNEVPYNPLHDQGFHSIGCQPCTTAVAPGEDPRAGRWRGKAKTECGLHAGPGNRAPAPKQEPAAARGFIVWFTGMSGAGKSTLSGRLRDALQPRTRVEVLDGDEVRTYLSKGLGFSREDRDTNVLRIGYVARLLAKQGVAVITAAISPYRDAREEVRALAEKDGIPFIEVHAHAELDALVKRDVKGLYRRALAGELPNFTGVSDPYEPPASPEVTVRSDLELPEVSLARILEALQGRGLLAASREAA